MDKYFKIAVTILFLSFILFSFAFCAGEEGETFTITTYYPSPYGSYNELTTYSNTYLATNNGNVGIGTTGPGSTLDVGGTSNSAFIQNLAAWGLNARTQGLIIMPEGNVTDDGAGNLVFGSTVIIMNPLSGSWIRVAAGTYALGGWGALWAPIPPTGTRGTAVAPSVTVWSDTDRNYVGRDGVLLAQRIGNGRIMTTFGNFANLTGTTGHYLMNGNVGIGTMSPTLGPLQMGSGAYVTAGGVWTNASSRTYKQDIAPLGLDKAMKTLIGLQPVTFSYKRAPDEQHVGFISEDVPELVATKDRTGLSAMDIVAVLTKAVQEQQKEIENLKQEVSRLKRAL